MNEGGLKTYVQIPSMGRIVIYRYSRDGKCPKAEAPAIITRALEKAEHGQSVNLQVLPDCSTPFWLSSVPEIDPDDQDRTGWFWPPRV